MKRILCFIVVLYGISGQQDGQPNRIQQFFKDRCYKNSKKGDSFDQLWGLSYDFIKYAEYTATFLPQHLPHFCKEERPILTNKMKDILNLMSDCLPKEEQFLKSFIADSFNEFLHFLCHDNGQYTKTFFSSQGKECRAAIKFDNTTTQVEECFSRMSPVISEKGFIQKKDLCKDITMVRACFTRVIDQYCRNFRAFNEVTDKFFRYINAPCSSCMWTMNNLILVLSVSVALLYNKLY